LDAPLLRADLEVSMMMLDYNEFTGDMNFARHPAGPCHGGAEILRPTFLPRRAGKLLLDPVNAIEQFWKVHDPAARHRRSEGRAAAPARADE